MKYAFRKNIADFSGRLVPCVLSLLIAVMCIGTSLLLQPRTAAADALTIASSADTYVYSGSKTRNYGSSTALLANYSSYRTLLSFDTRAVTASSDITSVQLRIYSANTPSGGGVQVHQSQGLWDEKTVTWNSQPAWDTTVVATSATPVRKSWVTIDIPATAIVPGGMSSFGLDYSIKGTRASISSRETNNSPQLIVNYTSTPPQQPPTAVTSAATQISDTSAVLNGSANDNGTDTTCVFDYGLSTDYGQTTPAQAVAAGSGSVTLTASLDNLQTGSTYSYRLDCSNAYGTNYGDNISFTATTPPPPTHNITKVLWVMEENTSETELMSNPDTAYFQDLANTYGLLANMHNETEPSMPNYIAALSGDTYGLADDSSPSAHPLHGQTLFGQLPAGQAASFAESMPANCYVKNGPAEDTNFGGAYAVRHTGWPYFVDASERSLCDQYQVNLQDNFQTAIDGGLPAFTQVTPALCNDFHKGRVSGLTDGCNFDAATGPNLNTRASWWLQTWLPKIMAGPDYQSGNLAIFVVWDEGNGSGSTNGMDCTTSTLEACHPPAIVISPYTHNVVSSTHYTHYDVLRTTEELLGLQTYLGHAAEASSFAHEFGLN